MEMNADADLQVCSKEKIRELVIRPARMNGGRGTKILGTKALYRNQSSGQAASQNKLENQLELALCKCTNVHSVREIRT